MGQVSTRVICIIVVKERKMKIEGAYTLRQSFLINIKECYFMKSLKQKILAAKIEYHWWCIGSIRRQKKERNANETSLSNREDFHKFKAEQLSVEYEIYAGLRDYNGKIVA